MFGFHFPQQFPPTFLVSVHFVVFMQPLFRLSLLYDYTSELNQFARKPQCRGRGVHL